MGRVAGASPVLLVCLREILLLSMFFWVGLVSRLFDDVFYLGCLVLSALGGGCYELFYELSVL